MSHRLSRTTLLIALLSCSAEPSTDQVPQPQRSCPAQSCDASAPEMRCDADRVQTCKAMSDGCGAWVVTESCSAKELVCASNACVAPSARQLQALANVRATIAFIERNAGLAPGLKTDTESLYQKARATLLGLADTPSALPIALRQVSLAYPIGHLTLFPEGQCGTRDNPIASTSMLQACAQPYRDHAVITYAPTDNPLGLMAGDEVLAVDGDEGEAMMQRALEQPLCTAASASASNRRFTAATSLFAAAHVGTRVTLRHLNGTLETKDVTKVSAQPISCLDPFGRDTQFVARSERRKDGTAVIRVPLLYASGTTPDDVIDRVRAEIQTAFDAVKDAPIVVWDFRANGGGASIVGLEIVAGMKGTIRGTPIAGYDMRTAGTTTYSERTDYQLPQRSAFPYQGKVALLIDGLTISAADYTALAAKRFGVPLVGAAASGAYGGGTAAEFVGAQPRVMISPDPFRGLAMDGSLLEGHSVEPDFAVELSPSDLAAGVDTVLEAAIRHAK